MIIENIDFIPLESISPKIRNTAFDLCKNVDPKDSPFLALSLHYNCPLWTGDKKLISGLQEIGFNNFYKFD